MEPIWEWYLDAERKGWSEDAAEDAMEFAQNDLDEINTVIAHAKLLRGRIDESSLMQSSRDTQERDSIRWSQGLNTVAKSCGTIALKLKMRNA